jgi:hypothetical protein
MPNNHTLVHPSLSQASHSNNYAQVFWLTPPVQVRHGYYWRASAIIGASISLPWSTPA